MTQDKTNRAAYIALGVMVGGAAGVAAGMLTAPKSGEEMRAHVKRQALKAKSRASGHARQKRQRVAEKISQTLEKSKQVSDRVAEKSKSAVDRTASRARRAIDQAQTEQAQRT